MRPSNCDARLTDQPSFSICPSNQVGVEALCCFEENEQFHGLPECNPQIHAASTNHR
jgi:hypothetical protein